MTIIVRNAANGAQVFPPDPPFVRTPEKGDLVVAGGQPHEVVRVIHLWGAGNEPLLYIDLSPLVTTP
jgi:hypothetical protein